MPPTEQLSTSDPHIGVLVAGKDAFTVCYKLGRQLGETFRVTLRADKIAC